MTDAKWPRGELVTLWGGPMDGEQMSYEPGELPADPTVWGGYYMVPEVVTPAAPEGVELRAVYEPRPGESPTTWYFDGWVPW
ncbi:hypothetical protein [Nocardiopsis synnemataformans]|uniref:hypothetical protein n=1 Tax=Nocardiopsis synnemataformans TaxID=61305 RepID=UPI003EB73665